jgi:hypothetical protein
MLIHPHSTPNFLQSFPSTLGEQVAFSKPITTSSSVNYTSVFLTPNIHDHPVAQQWADVEVVDLEGCARGAIMGRKPQTVYYSSNPHVTGSSCRL